MFRPLLRGEGAEAIPTLISIYKNLAFTLFIDNYIRVAEDFNSLFNLLYTKYFPRVVFSPIYLALYKTKVFIDTLEIVGFTRGIDGLRLATKYREKAIL